MKNDAYEENYFKKRLRNRNLNAYSNDYEFINHCLSRESHILDYGCGEMVFTKILAARYKLSVFDISQEITKTVKYKSYERYSTELKYDCIILRGIIQHHPSPFELIKRLCSQVNQKGSLVFLSTPNTNSLYYLLNRELPALDRKNNFWIPSNIELEKYMNKIGWYIKHEQYPYLKSGYAKPIKDHVNFLINILSNRKIKYPFWGSMMNLAFTRGCK